jgi:hypothetical protein
MLWEWQMTGRRKMQMVGIRHGIKPGARRLAYPTISIRIHNNFVFVIDSHFERYYTHHIEVTPICDYFTQYPVLSINTRGCFRVYFLYSLKKGD